MVTGKINEINEIQYPPGETKSSPLKMNGWKMTVSFLGPGLCSGATGNHHIVDVAWSLRTVFFVHRIQQIAKKLNTKHSRYIIGGIGKKRYILIVFFSVWKWGKTACQKIVFPCEAWYVSWSCSVSWFTTSRCHDCLGDTLTLHVLAVLNLFDRMVEVRCDCC